MKRRPTRSTLFPYATLFRSGVDELSEDQKATVSRPRRLQRFMSQPMFVAAPFTGREGRFVSRSEQHTSELQSRQYLVCRLLLEQTKLRFRQFAISGHA